MCALLSVGAVVSQSQPLYQSAKWPVLPNQTLELPESL
jgi:hypothetical protein